MSTTKKPEQSKKIGDLQPGSKGYILKEISQEHLASKCGDGKVDGITLKINIYYLYYFKVDLVCSSFYTHFSMFLGISLFRLHQRYSTSSRRNNSRYWY